MANFKGFLQELSISSGIRFELTLNDGTILFSCGNLNEECKYYKISLGEKDGIIKLPKSLENCAALLIYTIENKYKEASSFREQLFIDIIENKQCTLNIDDKSFSLFKKGSTLFVIEVNGSKHAALNIIRQLYDTEEVLSFIYNNNIVIYGVFDEVLEHGESIKEAIVSELYCKCKICYSEIINEMNDMADAYEKANEAMFISKKFKNKEEVFQINRFQLEKIVYNISDNIKQSIKNNNSTIFDSFDSEAINTIEEFFNNNLNLSDTSKKLYVHRNTLIYRLDKIARETGLDLRKFNDASLFKIAFLIWKESSRE